MVIARCTASFRCSSKFCFPLTTPHLFVIMLTSLSLHILVARSHCTMRLASGTTSAFLETATAFFVLRVLPPTFFLPQEVDHSAESIFCNMAARALLLQYQPALLGKLIVLLTPSHVLRMSGRTFRSSILFYERRRAQLCSKFFADTRMMIT